MDTMKNFLDELASSAPAPGGGGASALVGAIGTALGAMVGNLTSGKKKYAEYQADIERMLEKAPILQQQLLALIDKDAEVFEPLAKAYSIPKDDPTRAEVMEQALKAACTVPIEIMQRVTEAIELHRELAIKGTKIAVSDVGVGVIMCRSALLGASLNVFINTKAMQDKEYAAALNKQAESMIENGIKSCDEIFNSVLNEIK